jgi:hypothetical protein
METNLRDKIRLKQVQISIEKDFEKKQNLQKQLTKLRLRLQLKELD